MPVQTNTTCFGVSLKQKSGSPAQRTAAFCHAMGKLTHWRTSAGYRKVYLNPDISIRISTEGNGAMPQGAVFFAGCNTRVKRRHMRLDISQSIL
jgi:hypothetical protein